MRTENAYLMDILISNYPQFTIILHTNTIFIYNTFANTMNYTWETWDSEGSVNFCEYAKAQPIWHLDIFNFYFDFNNSNSFIY